MQSGSSVPVAGRSFYSYKVAATPKGVVSRAIAQASSLFTIIKVAVLPHFLIVTFSSLHRTCSEVASRGVSILIYPSSHELNARLLLFYIVFFPSQASITLTAVSLVSFNTFQPSTIRHNDSGTTSTPFTAPSPFPRWATGYAGTAC